MRHHKIFIRDPKSNVQITNAIKTRDVIRSFAAGKPVELNKGVDTRSYDFPDGEVDFDAPFIEEAQDLIEQSFMKDVYFDHLNPKKPGEPLPPTTPVDPSTSADPPAGD